MTDLDWDPHCSECNRGHMNLMWHRGDFANLKRKASGARVPDHGFSDRLAAGKAEVEEAELRLEAHLFEAHPDGIVRAPRKIADVRRKKAPAKGTVKCLSCGKHLTPVGTRLRKHNDKDGWPCPNVTVPSARINVEAPPIDLNNTHHAATKGECRECGKWLPGERSLCGRCSVQGRAS